MGTFVFSYRMPADYTPGPENEVGGSESRLSGYSVVSADDLESAVTLAKGCPALRVGGGVEVGPVMEAEGV